MFADTYIISTVLKISNEINEMLDIETNNTNRISKSYFVFQFFNN